jgi:hypothetical protein
MMASQLGVCRENTMAQVTVQEDIHLDDQRNGLVEEVSDGLDDNSLHTVVEQNPTVAHSSLKLDTGMIHGEETNLNLR